MGETRRLRTSRFCPNRGAWFSSKRGPGRAERRVKEGASSSADTGENDYNRNS